MSKGLEAFAKICVLDVEVDMYSQRERSKDVRTVKKELKALEIIKKYTVFNGWSGDYTIRFWDMKEDELKLIDEVLHE